MPYKIVPTKTCSECGQVLESVREDYCDGCNTEISQEKEEFEKHVRLGFQMIDYDARREDEVFCSLGCFRTWVDKIDLKGVDNVSIEFMSPSLFKEIAIFLQR